MEAVGGGKDRKMSKFKTHWRMSDYHGELWGKIRKSRFFRSVNAQL
jgi:hypothetical protein